MFKSLGAAYPPGPYMLSAYLWICMLKAEKAPPTNPDDATKQALLAVVQVWLDRLQTMSIIVSRSSLNRAYTHLRSLPPHLRSLPPHSNSLYIDDLLRAHRHHGLRIPVPRPRPVRLDDAGPGHLGEPRRSDYPPRLCM